MQRDDAYRIVQQAAHQAWDERIALRELLAARLELELELDAIFDVADATRLQARSSGASDALPTRSDPRRCSSAALLACATFRRT